MRGELDTAIEPRVRICTKHRRMLIEDTKRDQLRCPEGDHVAHGFAVVRQSQALQAPKEPTMPETKKREKSTLASTKFTDGTGAVLRIRLVRKPSGEYRIQGAHAAKANDPEFGGMISSHSNYTAQLAAAKRKGWTEAPSSGFGRAPRTFEIPAAKAKK